MKNSYTTIYYKDRKISGIFAATLDNDFYDEALLGSTNIVEEIVPKRDMPYFYGISREPLEFEVTFAFKKPMSIYEIKEYVEMFYDNETYQTLAFEREDGFITPIYYVIVTGEPEIEYMRQDTDEYIGYFKLNFRCNAPYGFEERRITLEESSSNPNNTIYPIDLSFASMDTNRYLIELAVTKNEGQIEIKNTINGVSYSFKFRDVKKDEIIRIDGRNKRITSHILVGNELQDPEESIYLRWLERNKGFIPLSNKVNNFTVAGAVDVRITYSIPRFI